MTREQAVAELIALYAAYRKYYNQNETYEEAIATVAVELGRTEQTSWAPPPSVLRKI